MRYWNNVSERDLHKAARANCKPTEKTGAVPQLRCKFHFPSSKIPPGLRRFPERILDHEPFDPLAILQVL